jgi:hypothetical protein
MNKHIIVFCEGEHDIAFLTRVLLVEGFIPYTQKVKDFDRPLNKLYQENLSSKKIANYEFKFQRPKRKVPYSVLMKDDVLIIFHNFDGDGAFFNGGADSIVKMYLDLNNEKIRRIDGYDKLNYRFLYFLDSDDQGIDARLATLKEELNIDSLNSHEIIMKDDYEVGCYIFHDNEHTEKHGKLENIILKLMSTDNQSVFEDGTRFIDNNCLDDDRCKKFICNELNENYVGSPQFKKMKSMISVAGQLQFSGSSNSVIIANSDFIKKEHLIQDLHCRNILTLFNTMAVEQINKTPIIVSHPKK